MVDAERLAKEQYLACAFILGADKTRYGRMLEDLKNSFTQGVDKYPKNMTDAYNLLVNWKQNPQNYLRVVDSTYDGAMFLTEGNDGKTNAEFTGKCWICKEVGHRKNDCPMRAKAATSEPEEKQTGPHGTQLLMDRATDDDQKPR
jgi:hypothetical protein